MHQRQDSSFMGFNNRPSLNTDLKQNEKELLTEDNDDEKEVFEVADLTAAFAFQYDVTLRGG